MFPESNPKNYFQDGTTTPAQGKTTKSPDYTSKIGAPTFKGEIDFAMEASTPDVDRQFIGHILTEQGALPDVAPKVGNANTKKGKVKGY